MSNWSLFFKTTINLFLAKVAILYPLETTENQMFRVFSGGMK